MDGQNWIVTAEGDCEPLDCEEFIPKGHPPYRFYRFLTDLDDVLDAYSDDVERLRRIAPKVRRVMEDSYWLQLEYKQPHPQRGWSVSMLYDEPGYPLTVQMVAWSPQQLSTIHNHATWGLVLLLDGEEKNTFWRQTGDAATSSHIERVGDCVLSPGDLICFVPEAIQQQNQSPSRMVMNGRKLLGTPG
ncbi:MAG: hypothetical protein F6K03_13945, partial [Kamptonema sp. SIO4C4]|nr:hypothetical protein [Kamptonema sp. SIO4C4]